MLSWFSWEYWSFLKTLLVNGMKKFAFDHKRKSINDFPQVHFQIIGPFAPGKPKY